MIRYIYKKPLIKLRHTFKLLILICFSVSCKVLKTPYGQSFVEYEKPARYNSIEYSIAKGDTVYYVENTLNNHTYLLWITNKMPLHLPQQSELPKGFGISKIIQIIPAKFSLNYKCRVPLMNDQYQNVYMRIH